MQPYRHYLILAIICLIFGSFPLDLHAQWEQTNGPEGSVVYDVILHNGVCGQQPRAACIFQTIWPKLGN